MDVQVQRLGWGEIHNILYFKKRIKTSTLRNPGSNRQKQGPSPRKPNPPTQPLETKPPTFRIQAPTYRNTRLQNSETKLQPSKSKLAPTLRNLKQQSSEPKSDFFFLGGQYPVRYWKGESAFFSEMRQTTKYILLLKLKHTA